MDNPAFFQHSQFAACNWEEEEINIMDDCDLEFFRRTLTENLNDLSEKCHEEVEVLLESAGEVSDFVDQAAMETDRSFRLRIRDRENRLIQKVEAALMRIEEGTFGICEVCGEEISINRLKARPVATHCIHCKSKAEILEKAVG